MRCVPVPVAHLRAALRVFARFARLRFACRGLGSALYAPSISRGLSYVGRARRKAPPSYFSAGGAGLVSLIKLYIEENLKR